MSYENSLKALVGPVSKPILISGMYRSGTTWVGKVVKSSKNVNYYAEPFNFKIKQNKLLFNDQPNIWFMNLNYINDLNYEKGLSMIINQKFTSLRPKAIKEIFYYVKFNLKYRNSKRVLIKDPISIFSADWINKKFSTQNIIIYRKPESFIASLKNNNWHFDFNNFLKQEEFVSNELSEYKQEIDFHSKNHNKNKNDLISSSVLLWKILAEKIIFYKKNYPNWKFFSYEDLSYHPQKNFKVLFKYLDIDFNKKVIDFIKKTTSYKNYNDRDSVNVNMVMRDINTHQNSWKNRLNAHEINYISSETKLLVKKLYDK